MFCDRTIDAVTFFNDIRALKQAALVEKQRPAPLIGRRHRVVTVPGGLLVIIAAAIALGRAAIIGERVATAILLLGPILGTLVTATGHQIWFRRLGFGLLVVNGLVLLALMILAMGAWKWSGYFSIREFGVMAGVITVMIGVMLATGKSPIFEWRVATSIFVANGVLWLFMVTCPNAPHAGSLTWVMLAGLGLIAVGLAIWRHEVVHAAITPLPAARVV